MRASLLEYLQCPDACETPLTLSVSSKEGNEIVSGALRCPDCLGVYPIEQGIPRMLPAALTGSSTPDVAEEKAASDDAATRKRTEMQARDAQVDDYDRMWHLSLFGMVEVPVTLLNLSLGRDDTLLEAGCGTGRMTRDFAARCAEQVSIDFSWESLRVCDRKLKAAGISNVRLVQADICHLPLRAAAFDRVVSCQVLEHVPEPAQESAVEELARVLRPGGNLTLSAYQYSGLIKPFVEKKGEHDGGIPFFRFTREELRSLLARHLTVEGITGALVYHYIARCRKT
jgi:SAM-dependent methyltransferase/uncharacterized protein YbaR (Trm112 family)